jgi:hypothetical protein
MGSPIRVPGGVQGRKSRRGFPSCCGIVGGLKREASLRRRADDAVATSREGHRLPRSGPAVQHLRWGLALG